MHDMIKRLLDLDEIPKPDDAVDDMIIITIIITINNEEFTIDLNIFKAYFKKFTLK